MNLVLYIFILVLSVIFWYNKKYKHRNDLLAKISAPPNSLPILNHSLYFFGKKSPQVLEMFQEFALNYGPVWRFDMSPFKTFINVIDPKVIEGILSSQKLLDKSDEYEDIIPWLGTGLLISTGKKWHQRRKIITPAFHFKILEEFVEIMNKHGDIFVKKLAKYDKPTDIFPMVSLYTLDVICESAMGYQLNAQIDDTSEYVKAVKEIASIMFAKSFDITKNIKIIYQFTSMCKREKELIKRLHDFTNSVISVRRNFLKQRETLNGSESSVESVDEIGMKKKMAFLDLLLQVKVEGEPLSDESIREEVDTFMFEGHDTTSSAITFILLNLAKYQDIQKKVYEDCLEIFGDDLSQPTTMIDLNKLIYLERVIKESLRLYPSVTVFGRKFKEDETIGDYTFPADTSIRISPLLLGRNPKIFPDPLKFDPSRFEDEKNIKLFTYVPFSAGPRNCIGQRFAMLELKSIVSKIVRNYEIFVRKEDENPIIASELVLRPVNGVDLYFRARKR